jgi:hypothetical protein
MRRWSGGSQRTSIAGTRVCGHRAELPDSTKTHYQEFAVIEITPDERFLSWDNSRLLRTFT